MKKYLITVKGISYEVEVEEIKEENVLSRQKEMEPKIIEQKAEVVAEKKSEPVIFDSKKIINSPMPGSILKVKVKAGDSVKKGDVLVILEAMKMENEILAPDDEVVASVSVSEGATVSTGDILVTFK